MLHICTASHLDCCRTHSFLYSLQLVLRLARPLVVTKIHFAYDPCSYLPAAQFRETLYDAIDLYRLARSP